MKENKQSIEERLNIEQAYTPLKGVELSGQLQKALKEDLNNKIHDLLQSSMWKAKSIVLQDRANNFQYFTQKKSVCVLKDTHCGRTVTITLEVSE